MEIKLFCELLPDVRFPIVYKLYFPAKMLYSHSLGSWHVTNFKWRYYNIWWCAFQESGWSKYRMIDGIRACSVEIQKYTRVLLLVVGARKFIRKKYMISKFHKRFFTGYVNICRNEPANAITNHQLMSDFWRISFKYALKNVVLQNQWLTSHVWWVPRWSIKSELSFKSIMYNCHL